ncbi:MAG: porphobilinogen synthase, partial [Clostridiales bacterium]|jgi:porphobilinogen synthase|nr:porphobilinogen synthase [Clostridiales bacterium]
MIKAAAAAGLLREYEAVCETAAAVFRAGAGIYFTYFARELAQAMAKGDIG